MDVRGMFFLCFEMPLKWVFVESCKIAFRQSDYHFKLDESESEIQSIETPTNGDTRVVNGIE